MEIRITNATGRVGLVFDRDCEMVECTEKYGETAHLTISAAPDVVIGTVRPPSGGLWIKSGNIDPSKIEPLLGVRVQMGDPSTYPFRKPEPAD